MKAKLVLENGMEFDGNIFGYSHETVGEVIFNTSMSGYQEVLTDPASLGKIIVCTYPLIGNYGINLDDSQSDGAKVSGFVVREKSSFPNNFRCELELEDYLKSHKVTGLEGIDTRELTKVLRKEGTMKGIIIPESSGENKEELITKIKQHKIENPISKVSTKKIYEYSNGKTKVAVIDLGVKDAVLRNFAKRDCAVTVYPHDTSADEILKNSPDLVFISDGPSVPTDEVKIIDEIKKLSDKVALAGISLGHELIALAFGGKVGKLKFGHNGGQSVKNIENGKVYVTAQGHNYVVETVPVDFEVTHISVNDKSIEGIRHKNKPIFSIQFNAEGCPGAEENEYIFDEFIKLAGGEHNA